MRLPWTAVGGGALVLAIGAAGLIRGAVPQSSASGSSQSADPIVVTGAYIRPPVPPTKLAAAYFTVYNTTGSDDLLQSVVTGAGGTATLHAEGPGGSMIASGNGAVIPAHGKLVLSAGQGHVMIGDIFGTLKVGQDVDIELQFRDAGPIDVVAPVIAFGSAAPTASGSPPHDSSGAHS